MRLDLCTIALFLFAAALPAQIKNGDWPCYTAALKGTKYSPLDQINASNFNNLEVAWRLKTDNLGPRPEYKLEGTPLVINGIRTSMPADRPGEPGTRTEYLKEIRIEPAHTEGDKK